MMKVQRIRNHRTLKLSQRQVFYMLLKIITTKRSKIILLNKHHNPLLNKNKMSKYKAFKISSISWPLNQQLTLRINNLNKYKMNKR
jgi:hypothetical protein